MVGALVGDLEAVGPDVGVSDVVGGAEALSDGLEETVGAIVGVSEIDGCQEVGGTSLGSKLVSLGLTEGLKDGLGVGAHVGPRPCRFIFKQSFPVDTGGSWSIKSHCNFLFSLAPRT
jgi:hypothetical protein